MNTAVPASVSPTTGRPAWRPSVLRLGLGRVLLEIKDSGSRKSLSKANSVPSCWPSSRPRATN